MDRSLDTTAQTAQVLLDVATRSLSEPLDYLVPERLAGSVAVGCPVLAPLGSRQAVGYVVSMDPPTTDVQLKELSAVLGEPRFDERRWSLASWISTEYACRPIEALRLFLPPGSSPRLVKTGEAWTLAGPSTSPLMERMAELVDRSYVPRPNARAQRAVIAALHDGPLSLAELRAACGDVSGAVRSLEAMGVITVSERRRWRSASSGLVRDEAVPVLNRHQQAALDAICSAPPGSLVLLDGVTGSGKTEVYVRAVEAVLRAGRQAIVLVPEISLTPQTVGRFRSRFGAQLAVLHSRLSEGERLDQWQLVATGEARLVIGARSALFAPVGDLGLIVIDEEHEPSYKQGSEPRYHARDVAREIARRTGAVVVLGSATPSVETVHAVRAGAVVRCSLPERATGAPLPTVAVVDMTKEFAAGNRSMFSRTLAKAIEDTLRRRRKAVLYINRRGFASFVLCRECGFVPRCSSCSVSLTYHETRSALQCHHCGHREPMPVRCPRCGSPYLRRFGAGTQRVEAEILARWPDVPVVRMDADTTRGKGGHERVLRAFEELPYGILVGTQMVAKGLDYPDIDLVGVVDADTTMHVPDFRATERTFQLLMQVSGRAGRAGHAGSVVIQTYWADHPAIQAVLAHDRDALYDAEIAERAALSYPPFARLARILVASSTQSLASAAAASISDRLRQRAPDTWLVLGPTEPAIAKLKGFYRQHAIVRAPADARLGPVLWEVVASYRAPDGVRVTMDVDPYDML